MAAADHPYRSRAVIGLFSSVTPTSEHGFQHETVRGVVIDNQYFCSIVHGESPAALEIFHPNAESDTEGVFRNRKAPFDLRQGGRAKLS